MPINSLIVGLGKIGLLYDLNKKISLTHSKCINTNKKYNLIGGIDNNLAHLRKFKNKFNKPVWNSISNCDLKEMIDLVIISTNIEQRYENVKEIIHHIKPKNILIEKPISYSLTALGLIKKIAKKNKINIYVNYPRNNSNLINFLGKKIDKIKKKTLKKIIITVPNPIKINIFHYIQLLFFLVKRNKYKDSYLFHPKEKILNKNFAYLKYIDFEIYYIFETNLNYRKGSFNICFKNEEINFERSVSKLNFLKFKKGSTIFNDQTLESSKKFEYENNQANVYNKISERLNKHKKNNLITIDDENIYLKFYKIFLCN